jgi:outer membrane protein OmpA-like peptidoglycan-associated protein
MRKGQQTSVSVILAAALAATMSGFVADSAGFAPSAQAQSADQRKKEQERQRSAPPPRPQPPPPPRTAPPPPRVTTPPSPPPRAYQKELPPPARPPQQFQQPPPPAAKTLPPTRPGAAPPPDSTQEGIRRLPTSPQQGVAPPPTREQPPAFQRERVQPPVARPPAGPAGPATVAPAPQRPPLGTPRRFDEIQKGRQERVEEGGRRKLIQEPGNRLIVREGNRAIIRHDETQRFLRRPGAQSERRPDGNVETSYVRRDGVRIVTIVDGRGRLLRRFRRDRDGREYHIIDNRRFYRNVGIGVAVGIVALALTLPRVTIPEDQYIVDYDAASDDDLYDTLYAPPVEALDRAYSLEEILDNYELRARTRRIDLSAVMFEFGSWEVPPEQYDRLDRVARAMLRVLRDNPEAVFLIEGHTDAVGSEEDNLSLSDRRAQSVAEILSDNFGVPPENLVTQGYGEQFLKIDTQNPEPRNRLVIIRNITTLMAER